MAEVQESPPKTEEIVEPEPEKDQSRKFSNEDSSVSGSSVLEDEGSSLQKGSISQARLLQRWDTKNLIELGSIKLSKQKSLATPSERKFEVIVENNKQQVNMASNTIKTPFVLNTLQTCFVLCIALRQSLYFIQMMFDLCVMY